jgi:hypothetical protein
MIPELVLYYLLTYVGFSGPEAHVMTCVAKYESGLRSEAINLHNDNGTIDVGLLQINTVWFNTIPYCKLDGLQNPINNIKCARYIYQIQGYGAWVGYKKHKNTCDKYKVKGIK